MEKIRALLCFGLLAAFACQLVKADVNCKNYDEQIQEIVFNPLRDEILKNNVSYYNFGSGHSADIFGVSLSITNGRIGNLSRIGLHYEEGDTDASQLCVDNSTSTLVKTLSLTFTFQKLQATFDNLAIYLPILPTIGDSKTTVQYQDAGIFINVTAAYPSASDIKCTATLNSLKILGLGDLSVQFESGLINKLYAFGINRFWSTIKPLLENYGLIDAANTFLTKYGSNLIATMGSDVVCPILYS